MTANTWGKAPRAAAMLLALGFCALSPAALAQGQKESVGSVQSATAAVKIKSIDSATRHLVVTNDAGESFTLKAPDEVRNFDQLKVGDTIKAQYTLKTEFVLSAPNTPLPADSQAVVAARAAKGEAPAAGVANMMVVTGAVVGIDKANHVLKLVSPQGGEVHTITVKSAEGLKAFDKVKVGDTITAYVTESLIIAATP